MGRTSKRSRVIYVRKFQLRRYRVNKIFTTSPSGGRLAAAVFDFDGLIVDTQACWHAAYRAVLARRDRSIGPEQLAQLAGASVRAAALGLEVPPDELRAALRRAFAGATLAPLPGVEALIARLRDVLPLAIATNGPHDVALGALRRMRLDAAFTAVVSAEALPHEKPAPDVYLEACRLLAVEPAQAVAFEDSAIGVTAARRAGLVIVQVAPSTSEQADADLRLARLDDPRLVSFLQLAHAEAPR